MIVVTAEEVRVVEEAVQGAVEGGERGGRGRRR